MSDLLIKAKLIISNNRTDKPARDAMTTDERRAVAEDYAVNNHFLSAAHFTPDANRKTEFERLFRESLQKKGN